MRVPATLLLLPLLIAAAPASRSVVPAQVLKVVDGDTLKVEAEIWPQQTVTVLVRLDGIDAPEMRARCPAEREAAKESRDRLAALIADRPVLLHAPAADKYGNRVRARVTTEDGRDLGQDQLEHGRARPYGGGHRRGWC